MIDRYPKHPHWETTRAINKKTTTTIGAAGTGSIEIALDPRANIKSIRIGDPSGSITVDKIYLDGKLTNLVTNGLDSANNDMVDLFGDTLSANESVKIEVTNTDGVAAQDCSLTVTGYYYDD